MPHDQELIHGRFASLDNKVTMVKGWPGIRPEDVDAAIALAHENGTIALYCSVMDKSP